LISLFVERFLLSFTTLFLFPIPLALSFLVSVAIVVMIQSNSSIFWSGGTSLAILHTGDWILHSLPLIEMLLILAVGYLLYARAIIASELNAIRDPQFRTLYIIYWFISPLLVLLIYSLIFNPQVYYPTVSGFSRFTLTFLRIFQLGDYG
jgi:hypothetical protein